MPIPCPQTNPCNCIGPNVGVPTPPPLCPDTDKCLKLCEDILPCENAVGPCLQSGTYDFSSLNHNTTGCGTNPVLYSVEDYDKSIFASVTIDSVSGVITWVTADSDSAGKYGKICIKAICQGDCDNCNVLGHVVDFYIGVRDLCAAVVCDDCETCNPCTGECEENDVNLKLQSKTTYSNLTVNG
jgi:hypothetical protein